MPADLERVRRLADFPTAPSASLKSSEPALTSRRYFALQTKKNARRRRRLLFVPSLLLFEYDLHGPLQHGPQPFPLPDRPNSWQMRECVTALCTIGAG